jgi:hypothetical protein
MPATPPRPVTDRRDLHRNVRADTPFRVVADFAPSGDQPAAIDRISEAFEAGERAVTLLGATGTGKTFTAAKVLERLQRPCLVMAPNKTLAAQLANEFRDFLPDNTVEYFVSYYDYYQPEAYIPSSDTYIEKDSSINDEIDRLRHRATMALLSRRDVVVVASVSCIYGLGSPYEYEDHVLRFQAGDDLGLEDGDAQARRPAVRPQRPQPRPRHLPGPGRHPRGVPGRRRTRAAGRVLRRRGRTHRPGRSPSPARCRSRSSRPACSPRRTTSRRATRSSGRSAPSRPSSRSGSPTSTARASCSRRNGCACGPTTTSR